MVGLRKTVTFAKISPKMVNPRDIAGSAEEEEAEELFKKLTKKLPGLTALLTGLINNLISQFYRLLLVLYIC